AISHFYNVINELRRRVSALEKKSEPLAMAMSFGCGRDWHLWARPHGPHYGDCGLCHAYSACRARHRLTARLSRRPSPPRGGRETESCLPSTGIRDWGLSLGG